MKLRAKEIAKQAGVSEATVSLVLNNKPGVGEETRKRILNLIQERGFVPTAVPAPKKAIAGQLRLVIYKKHGIVIDNSYFYVEMMEEISRLARQSGYGFGVTYINEQQDHLPTALKALKSEKPAGILILATEMAVKDLRLFKSMRIPLVVLDNYFEGEELNSVSIDNIGGVKKVIHYLKEHGHSRITYIHSSVPINNFKERQAGFAKSIENEDLKAEDAHTEVIGPLDKESFEGILSAVRLENGPTAVFTDNDTIALALIERMKSEGIQVPDDLSVFGFDDTPLGQAADPKLSTVHVYKQQMGVMALKRLLELIEKAPEETVNIVVGTKLVIRKSTKVYRENV